MGRLLSAGQTGPVSGDVLPPKVDHRDVYHIVKWRDMGRALRTHQSLENHLKTTMMMMMNKLPIVFNSIVENYLTY